MLQINKIFIIAAIAICFLSSCRKLADINQNPNAITVADPQLLLPKIEIRAAQELNSTSPLYAIKMLVQSDGESSEQYYKWDRAGFDMFNNLRDVTRMAIEAERVKQPAYIAIAKFFRAYYFFNTTLTFGDIPYTAALQGENGEYKAPVYDDQKEIFKGILKELAEANDILKTLNGSIAGDIVYGNPEKWRKLINSYRLHVLMTLSKKTGEADLGIVQSFNNIVTTGPLFQSNQDNAQIVWIDQQNNRYPQFNSSSFGSAMYMDSTFIRRLQDRRDPRLFIYADQTKSGKESGKPISDFTSYEGGDPAAPYASINVKATQGNVSKVNERYYKDPTTEPTLFFSYSELQLILAEAALKGWINGNAETYYQNGVKASFAFYQTYGKNYSQYVNEAAVNTYLNLPINNFGLAANNDVKLEMIIMQKYLQSFFQRNWFPYYEALRTDQPAFRRPAGVNLPYRFMYPNTELNTNRANVEAAIVKQFGNAANDKISEKTWWLK